MTFRKLSCAALAVLLLVSSASLAPQALAGSGASPEEKGSYVLSDYENNQALAVYDDGETQVFSYDSQEELERGLEELRTDESVVWIQPNFTYANTGDEVDDPMFDQQWAMSNDGTFQLEEQENQFPVFDQPFGTPAAPGQWMGPGGSSGGRMQGRSTTVRAAQTTTAVSGVDINIQDAWQEYDGSRQVVVALIDTGVDYTHEDLEDVLWVNEGEIAGNGVDDDGNGYVDDVYGWNFYDGNNKVYTGSDDDHGTHGAGTIAASADNGLGVAGIAGQTGNVKIMALKALGGNDGSGTTESVIQAIRYAEANGASIVNLSLGSDTFDYALYLAMKNSDMLFVVAAGNDAADSDKTGTYPAAYDLDNIISVANLQADGTLHQSSNYGGASVDLAAPGTYILSTTTEGTYSYMTGTSMAAPMVTGVAALVYSQYEDITLADVKQIVLGSVTELDSLTGLVSTGGMLNAGAALGFDLSALEDITWNDDDAEVGSAPAIAYETFTQSDTNYLKLTVTDDDGDFILLAYLQGEQTAADFDYGQNGTAVTATDGTATFRIVQGGTYTFYALDQNGNQTVLTLTLEAASGAGSQTDSFPGGGQGARPGVPPGGMRGR